MLAGMVFVLPILIPFTDLIIIILINICLNEVCWKVPSPTHFDQNVTKWPNITTLGEKASWLDQNFSAPLSTSIITRVNLWINMTCNN